jgi:hypothetical protein
LDSLARSISITAELFLADRIITQIPFAKHSIIGVEPFKKGSLEIPLLLTLIPTSQGMIDGLITAAFWDFVKYGFKKFTGGTPGEPRTAEARKRINELGPTMDALEDKILPALRECHRPINRGATSLVFIQGDHNIVNFNSETKSHIEEEVLDDNLTIVDGSVGAFNANTNSGNIYLSDLGRNIAFRPGDDVIFSQRDQEIFNASQGFYIKKRPRFVRLHARGLRSRNGELRTLLVYRVEWTPAIKQRIN